MHDSMTVVISTVTLLANQCTSEPTACIPGNTEMLLSLAMQKGQFQKFTLLRLKNRDIYVRKYCTSTQHAKSRGELCICI